MKKTSWVYLLSLLFLALFILIITVNKKKPTDVVGEAKTVYYESVEELTKKADLIVTAIKTDEYDPVIKYSNGYPYAGYTLSAFRITSISCDHSLEYQVGDEIVVIENQFFDKQNNLVFHTAGYTMASKDEEYVLFLGISKTPGNTTLFKILGVNLGICSVENTYHMIPYNNEPASEFREIEQMRQEIYNRYINGEIDLHQ